jgi:hypothetical protein
VLSPSLYGNDYLVGEVTLHNTGNIGTVVRVRFTWPQEGMAPIVAHKMVRVPFGQSKTVRFPCQRRHVSNSNVIDLLQSWQEHHARCWCHSKAIASSLGGGPAAAAHTIT